MHLVLSLLYGSAITTVHDHWEDHAAAAAAAKSLQSCPTLSDPMDCSQPGSSVHGIFQARVLEWVDISFSREDHIALACSLCRQSDISAFHHIVWICHSFPAKKQSSSDFMAAVTICSDFRAQEEEICRYIHLFPSSCHEVMGPDTMILDFLIFSFKLALSLSFFTLTKTLFSSSCNNYNPYKIST